MAGKPKPGVDWASIQIEWEAGGSPSEIARRYPVTRQAVEARRNRHCWTRDEAAAALVETPTGKRLLKPKNQHDRKLIADGKRSLANMKTILEALSDGASVRLAAQRCGIGEQTLRDWLAADPDFMRLSEAAEAEAGLRAIGRVREAGVRGDWRADAYLLERMKATREDFAPRPTNAPLEGPGVMIHLVMRPENAALLNGTARDMARPVIDDAAAPPVEEGV